MPTSDKSVQLMWTTLALFILSILLFSPTASAMVARTLSAGFTVDEIVAYHHDRNFTTIYIFSYSILGGIAIFGAPVWSYRALQAKENLCLAAGVFTTFAFAAVSFWYLAEYVFRIRDASESILVIFFSAIGFLVFLLSDFVISMGLKLLRQPLTSILRIMLSAYIPMLLLTTWCYYGEVTMREALIKERANLGSSYRPYLDLPKPPRAPPGSQSSSPGQPPAPPPPRLTLPPEAPQ